LIAKALEAKGVESNPVADVLLNFLLVSFAMNASVNV